MNEVDQLKAQLAAVTKELDEAERKIPTTADAMAHFSLLNKLDLAQRQVAEMRDVLNDLWACVRADKSVYYIEHSVNHALSPSCGSRFIDARELGATKELLNYLLNHPGIGMELKVQVKSELARLAALEAKR